MISATGPFWVRPKFNTHYGNLHKAPYYRVFAMEYEGGLQFLLSVDGHWGFYVANDFDPIPENYESTLNWLKKDEL